MLKAVLFDMDGVLFDSMPGHADAWVKAVHMHGLDITPEEVYLNEGRTGASTISILTQRTWHRDPTEAEVKQIYADKCVFFNAYLAQHGEASAMRGAAEVLAEVKRRGLLPVLVTGSAQESLLTRLNLAYPDTFHVPYMVTANDVRYGKPNPEPYLMGLQKAGVTADEAIVVENAPLGVQAARAAGIFTIAVNTGPLSASVLIEAGANVVFPSMSDLAMALKMLA